MRWTLSWRASPSGRRLADRHYNRQRIGAPQFVPPGRCLVLVTLEADALWVTSWPFAKYVKHAWAGAWICSVFRREGGARASDLIRDAVAATRWRWPEVPALGKVTFIDEAKVQATMVRGRPVYGWTFRRAGFKEAGRTKAGLLVLRLSTDAMPDAVPALGTSRDLFEERRGA